MPSAPNTSFNLCTFEAHHTIELYNRNGEINSVWICFECGDTKWEASDNIEPKAFQDTFANFITPLDFKTSRDWHALAHDHSSR